MENDTPAIQHGYATYQPSLIERAWRGLGFRYHLGEEPEGADQLKGWMCTETRMRFSFADRLRLLLSGRLHIRLVLEGCPIRRSATSNRGSVMDKTEETRTVRDPFLGVDAVISSRLTDRLRGKYACGPTLPNGEPEFGWRENWTPPIQHEAAARIETLEADLSTLTRERDQLKEELERVYKVDDQKTREINILTRENRKVYGERDQAREALARTERNRDMWKDQCARQADLLSAINELPQECVNSLTHQRQIDMDGYEVGVSRQAVDEIHAALMRARSVLHQEEGPIDAALSAAPAPEAADGERS